jgi:RimJ/RimL family protein N-acetyltransferase
MTQHHTQKRQKQKSKSRFSTSGNHNKTRKINRPNLQSNQDIQLTSIRKSDSDALFEITSKPHIMKFIGKGNTWTLDEVNKYINYTIEDARIPIHKRDWFAYAIRYAGKLVGIIQFKTVKIYAYLPAFYRQKYHDDVALTIYINDTYQGKGIAKRAIELLKAKIRQFKPKAKNLIAVTNSTNTVMQHFLGKNSFIFIDSIQKTKQSGGVNKYLLYKLPLSPS